MHEDVSQYWQLDNNHLIWISGGAKPQCQRLQESTHGWCQGRCYSGKQRLASQTSGASSKALARQFSTVDRQG